MDLKSRLIAVAEAWRAAWADAEKTEVPPTRLAKAVMDDGKFFVRLDEARKGPTTDTLEKFARYFVDPVNWPGGEVPEAAKGFGHAVGVSCSPVAALREGVSPAGARTSPDNKCDSIGPDGDQPSSADAAVLAPAGRGPDSSAGGSGAQASPAEESFELTSPGAKAA